MRRALTIICILFSFTCISQDVAFVVMDVSGNVTAAGNRKLLVGTKVADNETINVAAGGKVSLACRNSGCAQFTTAGKYTLKSSQYCKPVNDPAFAKLCKFAWQQIAGSGHEEHGTHMNNVGAATRGAPCAANIDHNFSDISYYDGDLSLVWKPVSNTAKLYLKLYKNANSAAFLELPVTGNKYALATLKQKLKEGSAYYWSVTSREADCEPVNHLFMMTKPDHDSVISAFSVTVSANIADPAAQKYWTAILLENNHLLVDAYTYYKEAAKLAPGENRYKNEVAAFKKRYKTQ